MQTETDDIITLMVIAMNVDLEAIIRDYENAVCKIILYCVAELPFHLGISRTMSVLRGSKSTFVIRYGLNNLATYSMLSTFGREQLKAVVEKLIESELLEVESASQYENMPILKITEKGQDFITGEHSVSVQFLEGFVDRGVTELDESEEALFEELKKLRVEIAREMALPAYMICWDNVLRELSKRKPTDVISLLSVRGIGEKFAENYGKRFLRVIMEHAGVKSEYPEDSVYEQGVVETRASISTAQDFPQVRKSDPAKRQLAEQKLKQIFDLDNFYDRQWETIERLMNGERMLLIEKTGFGKSLCYQFPATQLPGITVIFSPLIALMRDQVGYLKSLGIAAECVNSEQEPDENAAILQKARRGRIKMLYIAPERQESRQWQNAVKEFDLSMVVVDEAHCVSIWGHDFRPAFRKIIDLVRLLPENLPVLATTATATQRVAEDIMVQMGGNVSLVRGNLLRKNLNLSVVRVDCQDAKLEWLGEFFSTQEGTGLIYTGRRVDTDWYASWLQYLGISAINYNAGLDRESRKEIEEGLQSNRWRCVVSTNALGMGIDKPDIRFIIHTQMPASPTHYYQEIGRAGRDGLPSEIALLYSPDDKDLPEYFIRSSRPATKLYLRVIESLKQEPLGLYDLIRRTNLNQNQIRVICNDLMDQGIVQGAIHGGARKYENLPNAPPLDTKPFEILRQFKFRELRKMIDYAQSQNCRMDYLCSYLGDALVERCGRCDNDLGHRHQVSVTDKWDKRIQSFQDAYFPELNVETSRSNLVNGIASSYYGSSDVGATIHHCKYENGGYFPDNLLVQTLKAYRKHFGYEKFDLVVYVPPTESGDLVENFAKRVARNLHFPISDGLKKMRLTEPQKVFQNSVLKRDNVKEAFIYDNPSEIRGKSVLVIDDIIDTGATIKEIGRMLTKLGAAKIAPLVIAKTVGGDI